jgi:beta-glucosidase-like glycosyl hydrolase
LKLSNQHGGDHKARDHEEYVDPDEAERVVGSDRNRTLARRAARETITLLKNDEQAGRNRVMTIDTMAQKLSALVPNARIVVGHGQMHSDDLEEVMAKFVNGEADMTIAVFGSILIWRVGWPLWSPSRTSQKPPSSRTTYC